MPINPGLDASGNGNNWTPINLQWVVAGVNYDIMVDSPTPYGTDTGVGGTVRGNYATLNPLASVSSPPTFANGNLEATGPASGVGVCQTTAAATSGKFYAEVTVTRTSDRLDLGIMGSGVSMTTTNYLGTDTNTIAYLTSTGVIRKDNTNNQTGLATCTTGDVVGMTVDMDTGSIQFYKNNATVGTAVSFTPSSYVAFLFAQTTSNNTSKGTWNFGQRAFAYTAPSGFKALCTTNLPTPTIGATSTTQAGKYMNVVTYTGNGTGQTISTVGFQPDLVWVKNRSNAGNNHNLQDSVRGFSVALSTSLTNSDSAASNAVSGVTSTGFTLGNNSNGYSVNENTYTYVAWNWNAGGSNATNTSGTITSTVRANTTSGFSIVQWTGSGANGTVGHGLGVAPQFMFMKNKTNGGTGWPTYHAFMDASAPQNYFISMASTDAKTSDSAAWNNTAPTSSVFSVGNSSYSNGGTMIAYVFAPVAGYSAFGSYTGNGSSDGPFVYLGFRPEFVMIKSATTAGTSWEMFDNARETSNLMDLELLANSSNAEGTYTFGDFVSNGFKLRSTNNGVNQSSATLIYMAFAENPFKYALAR